MNEPEKAEALRALIDERLGTAEPAEPVGVAADRMRQNALKERGENVQKWRAYINDKVPVEKIDGQQLGALVDAIGGVGFVSEVLGLRPSDIEASVKHSDTTFLSDKAVRKFITAAQMVLEAQRG